MNYVFLLFDSGGKITDAKVFPERGSQRTIEQYAQYIGLDIKVSSAVYRASGRFAGTSGMNAAVLGPYTTEIEANQHAAAAKKLGLIVDTAQRLAEGHNAVS